MQKTIQVNPYDCWLTISVSDDPNKAAAKWCTKVGKKVEEITCIACCVSFGRKFGIFFNKDMVTVGLISHEVFHAITGILSYCDTPLAVATHESYACLIEWATNETYKTLGLRYTFKLTK